MNKELNKGVKLSYIFIGVNLIIATSLIIALSGINGFIDIVVNFYINIGISIIALYFFGFIIGEKMDLLINIKNKNSLLIGVIGSLLMLFMGVLFGSTVGFLEEGLRDINTLEDFKDSIIDYYFKPFFWVLFFGIIPTIITGCVLGLSIKEN